MRKVNDDDDDNDDSINMTKKKENLTRAHIHIPAA